MTVPNGANGGYPCSADSQRLQMGADRFDVAVIDGWQGLFQSASVGSDVTVWPPHSEFTGRLFHRRPAFASAVRNRAGVCTHRTTRWPHAAIGGHRPGRSARKKRRSPQRHEDTKQSRVTYHTYCKSFKKTALRRFTVFL